MRADWLPSVADDDGAGTPRTGIEVDGHLTSVDPNHCRDMYRYPFITFVIPRALQAGYCEQADTLPVLHRQVTVDAITCASIHCTEAQEITAVTLRRRLAVGCNPVVAFHGGFQRDMKVDLASRDRLCTAVLVAAVDLCERPPDLLSGAVVRRLPTGAADREEVEGDESETNARGHGSLQGRGGVKLPPAIKEIVA